VFDVELQVKLLFAFDSPLLDFGNGGGTVVGVNDGFSDFKLHANVPSTNAQFITAPLLRLRPLWPLTQAKTLD